MTQALNRLRGVSHLVYTVPESEFAIDPFGIPPNWKRIFPMEVRFNDVAALWVACPPKDDVFYVYDLYCERGAEPGIHAARILSRGKWIPGLLDPMANGRSRDDGLELQQIYRDLGLDLGTVPDSEQSGVLAVMERMTSGRLKVFRTLERFFQEYRLYRHDEHGHVVKQNDLLMNCLRYVCVSGRDNMRTNPALQQFGYESSIPLGTPNGWLGS